MSSARVETALADDAGQRLDRWLRRKCPDIGQARIERMCRKGEIRIDGRRVKASTRLSEGQRIRMPPAMSLSGGTPVRQTRAYTLSKSDAERIRSCVLFRDEHILVLDKPPNLATQGGTKQLRHIDGMASALRFDSGMDPLLVHRLDKDTSGVLLMARTASCARILSAMFRRRQVEKNYWAVVFGVPKPSAGVISRPLYRSQTGGSRKMRCVPPEQAGDFLDAKHAVTKYTVLEALGRRVAVIALDPVTGRTHQLRAHLAEFGHPIVGDRKYGKTRQSATDENPVFGHGPAFSEGLHLHARSLAIRHPVSGEPLQFDAPPPPHMRTTLKALGLSTGDLPRNPFAADEWS